MAHRNIGYIKRHPRDWIENLLWQKGKTILVRSFNGKA